MKNLFVISLAITVFSILSFNRVNACPKCNADFKQELMEKRANTLGGQELLEAIKNQDGGNSVVLPVKYINNGATTMNADKEMITAVDTEDNPVGAFTLIKILITVWYLHG